MSAARTGWQNAKAQMSGTMGAEWVQSAFKEDLGPTFDSIDQLITALDTAFGKFVAARKAFVTKADAMEDKKDALRTAATKTQELANKKAKEEAQKKRKPEPEE